MYNRSDKFKFTTHPCLTPPNAADAGISQVLQNKIVATIIAQNGFLSFHDYMQLALYDLEYGYYSNSKCKFGHDGDFVTAPELTNLFAKTFATYVTTLAQKNHLQHIIEFGPGTGKFAYDLLSNIPIEQLPAEYWLIEISPALCQQQQQILARLPENFPTKLRWFTTPPTDYKVRGLVIANEVFDAMPVHCFTWMNHMWYERGVTYQPPTGLTWQQQPATGELLAYLTQDIAPYLVDIDYYASECNLHIDQWFATVNNLLDAGVIIALDYGFLRAEYYHPDRTMGTLMCHYQHMAHHNPFLYPGLQDLTAHVDFSAIMQAAATNQLEINSYLPQSKFLLNLGILNHLQQVPPAQYFTAAQAIKTLTMPAEMGELFKAIVCSKHCVV